MERAQARREERVGALARQAPPGRLLEDLANGGERVRDVLLARPRAEPSFVEVAELEEQHGIWITDPAVRKLARPATLLLPRLAS
jgi:hypothetical protein